MLSVLKSSVIEKLLQTFNVGLFGERLGPYCLWQDGGGSNNYGNALVMYLPLLLFLCICCHKHCGWGGVRIVNIYSPTPDSAITLSGLDDPKLHNFPLNVIIVLLLIYITLTIELGLTQN